MGEDGGELYNLFLNVFFTSSQGLLNAIKLRTPS